MGNRELSEQMGARRRRQVWGCAKTVVFIWARRKGGLFKDWFRSMSNRQLHLFYRYIKSLRCSLASYDDDRFFYGERQLSFDETPTFCFNLLHGGGGRRRGSDVFLDYYAQSFLQRREEEEVEEEEEGVDAKAEEFIAKFNEQMRFQRQVSLMQYNERLFIAD